MMNPSDIASRNLQHYTNTNSSDEWEQQLIGEHNNDNSTHLPFAFQAQSFNNTQGLLETLDEAVPTVIPTSFPTSTTPGNHFQPQIQPTPQLPSQMYLEAVPANNQRRSSSTNPSAQLNLYLTTSNHKHQRRSSTHSSPKPKRTRKNRPGKDSVLRSGLGYGPGSNRMPEIQILLFVIVVCELLCVYHLIKGHRKVS